MLCKILQNIARMCLNFTENSDASMAVHSLFGKFLPIQLCRQYDLGPKNFQVVQIAQRVPGIEKGISCRNVIDRQDTPVYNENRLHDVLAF